MISLPFLIPGPNSGGNQNRAKTIIEEFQSKHRLAKSKLQPGFRVDTLCTVGSLTLDLYTLRVVSAEIVEAIGKVGDEWACIIGPIEQSTLVLIETKVSQPATPEAQRRIGFGEVDAAKDAPFFGSVE